MLLIRLFGSDRHCLIVSSLLIGSGCVINSITWMFFGADIVSISVVLVLLGFGFLLLFFHLRKLFVLIIFFVLIAVIILQTALTAEDARNIWLYHAKFIFFKDSFYGALDPYDKIHPGYPAVYPALIASFFAITGGWNEVFPKIAILPFIVAPTLTLARYFYGRIPHLLVCGAIVLTCKINLVNGYVDGVLALHFVALVFLITAGFSHQFLRKKEISPLLLMLQVFILAANMLSLKNEGLALWLLLFIQLVCFRNLNCRRYIFFGLAAALLYYLASWKIPVGIFGNGTDLFEGDFSARILSRLQLPLLMAIFNGLMHDLWRWIFVLVFVKITAKRCPFFFSNYKFAITICTVYFFLLLVIYMGTPNDLNWHLNTSAGRVVTPIAMTFAFMLVHWFCGNPYLRRRV